jgi:acyl-CoA thioester hydrolase
MPTPSVFRTRLQLRWSDIDANFHLRHSVYYDLCAQQRVDALRHVGITMERMQQEGFAPVLFKEECTFRREIRLEDEVWLDLKYRPTGRTDRFCFVHTFTKADGTHCATVIAMGAWIDSRKRKVIEPPFDPSVVEMFPIAAE